MHLDCVQLKEKGETIKRQERGKLARMKRTMRLAEELPDSYRAQSRREKELLLEADAFVADFQVHLHKTFTSLFCQQLFVDRKTSYLTFSTNGSFLFILSPTVCSMRPCDFSGQAP